MKKAEIKVGGLYTARVNGKHVTVRVDAIRDVVGITGGHGSTHYNVTNMTTSRTTVFRSAAKFRSEVKSPEQNEEAAGEARVQAWKRLKEQESDLTPPSQAVPSVFTEEDADVGEGEHSSDFTTCVPTVGDLCLAEQTVIATTPNLPFVVGSLAAKIAAQSVKTTRVPETVAGYTPTDEQRAILEAVLNILDGNGPKVLVVNAGAGSGKTSTLRMLEEVLHGQIQYTAYNRPLVDESRTKFRKAKCSTSHGLAFQPIGRDYQHRLNGGRIRSKDVATMLGIESFTVELPNASIVNGSQEWQEAAQNTGYTEENPAPQDWTPKSLKTLEPWFLAGQVSQALKKFSQTADREIDSKHFAYVDGIDEVCQETGKRSRSNNDRLVQYLLPFARKFWEDVCDVNGTLPYQHDYYVKIWQLSSTAIIPANHIMLDEHQDTAPVFADVIQRQSATVVLVGDENQRIYEWRGAMNAADLFPDAPVLYLSQSFRFGQAVADVANSVLSHMEERTKLNMRGLATIPSRVLIDLPTDEYGNPTADERNSEHVGSMCYLYRTNAGAVARILTEYVAGRRGCLVGKVDEIVKFVEGARDLQSAPVRRTSHPELAAFETWKEVQKYVEEDPDGSDLKLMVKLVDEFKVGPILQALKNMPTEDQADFVCSTAHKSKGREWDTVVLGADFPPAHKMQDGDCRLLYVAATRARLVLDLTACTPFHYYRDKDGNEYPRIEVEFTAPQHSAAGVAAYLTARATPQIAAPKLPLQAPQSASGQSHDPTQKTAANGDVAPVNGNGNSRPPATGFTWTSFGGKWCARGPHDAKVGEQVRVVRKNGTSSNETLKGVVRKFDDACIYEV